MRLNRVATFILHSCLACRRLVMHYEKRNSRNLSADTEICCVLMQFCLRMKIQYKVKLYHEIRFDQMCDIIKSSYGDLFTL